MKKNNVLITGGAGFIGSFLTDRLLADGYPVVIFDNLEQQVHQGKAPEYLNPDAEFIHGDVRDNEAFSKALSSADIVFHLAAAVGVQQSQYEVKRYADINVGGMANLLQFAVDHRDQFKKIVLMSSMTGYGEGLYQCDTCGAVPGHMRDDLLLKKGSYEMTCITCGKNVQWKHTPEDFPLAGNSIYALTKKYQEELLMTIGKAYTIPVVAFRGFNIYGPRQSISNPYTGVTAIFISRLKNGKAPRVYEDGKQSRDFISVHDVVDALVRSIKTDKADYEVLNLGTGISTSVSGIAQQIAQAMGKDTAPDVSGEYRKNDLRHCIADISKTKQLLDWEPRVLLDRGIVDLVTWSETQESADLFETAEKELREKNIVS